MALNLSLLISETFRLSIKSTTVRSITKWFIMETVVLIPVYNCAKSLPAFFSFLYKLKPQPDLYVFAENNSDDDTLKCILNFRKKSKLIRVWFRKDAAIIGETRYEPIAHIRQLLITFARNYDPEYAVFLDSDVYPRSTDLIERLSFWGKDIVGGAYTRLFPQGVFIASKWISPDNRFTRMTKAINEPLSEPAVTSAGCLCLSRKIIQDKQVNFYPLSHKDASEDFGYCLQAREMGYKVYLDGTVELFHKIPKKMPRKAWVFDSNSNKPVPFYYNS
jgi:GT2 family glycosyltransferase